MKRLLLVLWLSVPLPAWAGPLVDQVVLPSVEVDGCGSGTVVQLGRQKLVLTAAHVVRGRDRVQVKSFSGRTERVRDGRVILYDYDRDLALIRLAQGDQDGLTAAHLAPVGAAYEIGDDIWYCGLGGGFSRNLQRSIINRVDSDLTWVNGGGWFGHSGSGLFRKRACCGGERYEIIGVVICGFNPIRQDEYGSLTGNPRPPVGCVPLVEVRKFLGQYKQAK